MPMPTFTRSRRRASSSGRRVPVALVIGLALSVIATLAPVVDIATIDTLSEHVRAAYPFWGPVMVAGDRNAIVIYLVTSGFLGIVSWLWTIWAVATGNRRAVAVATAAFVAGTCLALVNLTLGGGEYDIILPHTYGLLTLLPCLMGPAALVSVRRGMRGVE